MNNRFLVICLFLLTVTIFTPSRLFAQTNQKVVPPFMARSLVYDRPDMMMRSWYASNMDKAKQRWFERFERLSEPSEVKRYQKRQLDFILDRLDLPTQRDPLNAKTTGTLDRGIFRVEKIVFESQPKFYVSAALFLPPQSKFKPPYPAVVVACGHSDNGKAAQTYQRACILGAMNGLAMLIVDPIDQGERFEHLDSQGKPYALSVQAHNLVATSGIPLGRSTATVMIWDLIRAIDYLQERNDIIPDRIGAMGNSGGGTQTAYLMAIDERIACASPACYISSLLGDTLRMIGPPDDEQLIFGQGDFILEHADYGILRVPRPTLLCAATGDFFRIDDTWNTFRQMKRVYGILGFGERVELVETDRPHGYSIQLRQAAIGWMLRWLAGRDEAIVEDETIEILKDDELLCVPSPGVFALPGAQSVYDLNRLRKRQWDTIRAAHWKNMIPEAASDLVRQVARFRALNQLPEPLVRQEGPSRRSAVLESEKGIFLPIVARWEKADESITIVLDDQGRASPFVKQVFSRVKGDVLAVDLRGWGETQGSGGRHSYPEWFGLDRNEFYFAFLLGRTYVGMRTEDLFSVIRYCRSRGKKTFNVVARGGAVTIALHAATSEPGLFERIYVTEPLPDWSEIVEKAPCPVQLTDLVYGALKKYDKSDLRRLIKTEEWKVGLFPKR